MIEAANEPPADTRSHRMRLLPDLLQLVETGHKTIEVRVADAKGLAVRSSDLIELSPAPCPVAQSWFAWSTPTEA